MRLQMFVLAYNLGIFLWQFALPVSVEHWTLTRLRDKLIKIGARIVRRAQYVGPGMPTLGIRGEVDRCIPEVAWELVSPKSFRNGLTLEVMPGIGHFPQLENPQ